MVLINSHKRLFLVAALVLVCFGLVSASVPQKMEKQIDKIFQKHTGISKPERIAINPDPESAKALTFSLVPDRLFLIKADAESQGYVFIENAKGRYHEFTFMVWVDDSLNVRLIKVLEYAELYGSEITNKTWLAQFEGMNPESEIVYEQNIDAISGATISSKSITLGIKEVLQKLKELREKKIL